MPNSREAPAVGPNLETGWGPIGQGGPFFFSLVPEISFFLRSRGILVVFFKPKTLKGGPHAAHAKRSCKQQHQLATHKQCTTAKTATTTDALGRSKAARVCFSHNNRSKEARVRECLPLDIRWDTGKCCLNWLSKIVITILEGQTLQRWGEGGRFDSRQKQAQAAKTAATTIRNRNTNNKKSSRTESAQQSRNSEGGEASSRGISFGCVQSFFFSGFKQNLQQLVIDFFGSLMGWGEGGKSIVKLFLTFCKSHRSFTRQPVSPNVHSWHQTLQTPPKFHEKTRKRTKLGREREQGRNFGRSAEGRVWCPEGCPEGWGPDWWAQKGGAQNFAFFFPSPAPILVSFFLSLGGSSRGILVGVIEGRDPQMCTLEFSGCRVEAPAGGVGRGGPAESGGAQKIMDGPTKILNTHRMDTPTDTTQHNGRQGGLGREGGPSQGVMAQETKHEQEIVPKSSPIGKGFWVKKKTTENQTTTNQKIEKKAQRKKIKPQYCSKKVKKKSEYFFSFLFFFFTCVMFWDLVNQKTVFPEKNFLFPLSGILNHSVRNHCVVELGNRVIKTSPCESDIRNPPPKSTPLLNHITVVDVTMTTNNHVLTMSHFLV